MRRTAKSIVLVCGTLALFAVPASAEFYGFDAGPEGWTPGDPFGGGIGATLEYFASGGNPGGFISLTDTEMGGGSVVLKAPPEITGDLTRFESMSWDDYLPADAVVDSRIHIEGSDGTIYSSPLTAPPTHPKEQWHPHSVSFLSSAMWTLQVGTAPFETVVASATTIYIDISRRRRRLKSTMWTLWPRPLRSALIR